MNGWSMHGLMFLRLILASFALHRDRGGFKFFVNKAQRNRRRWSRSRTLCRIIKHSSETEITVLSLPTPNSPSFTNR